MNPDWIVGMVIVAGIILLALAIGMCLAAAIEAAQERRHRRWKAEQLRLDAERALREREAAVIDESRPSLPRHSPFLED